MLKRIVTILLIFFAWTISSLMAQDVQFVGEIRDYFEGSKLKNVTVEYQVDGRVEKTETITSGAFDLRMDYGKVYLIVFKAPGMIPKSFQFNTENVPEDVQNGLGTGFQGSVDMFPELEGFDMPELRMPVAKIAFSESYGDMDYDRDYTDEVLGKVEPALEQYREELERREKEKAAKQKEFDALIKAGDKAYAKAAEGPDFDIAIENYTKALNVFPDDVDAQIKLDEATSAKKSWEIDQEVAQEAELLKQFDAFMAAGDKALSANNLEEARNQFVEAQKLYPDDANAAQKIENIDAKLAALQQQEQQFKDLVAAADDAFKNEKYDEAKVKYAEAQALRSDDRYLGDQIKECDKQIALLKDKEALQQQFDALVQKGKDAENANNLETAVGMYQEAVNLMADEELSAKIADLEKQISEAKDMAVKQAEFDAIMENAIAAENEKDYQSAINLYDKALGIFPDKEEVKTKKAAIEKMIADELAAQQAEQAAKDAALALQKNYDDKIAAAQKAYKGEQYQESIGLYNEALALIDTASYPKEQITIIENILEENRLAEEAKAKETADAQKTQEAFDALMASADEAMKNENWDEAKSLLQQADEKMPNNTVVPGKLKEIESIIAQKEADEQAEKDRLAADALKKEELYKKQEEKADKLFEAGNYEGAITAYEEALAIDGTKDYAKSRKDEAERRLKEINDAKSAEELAAQKLEEEQAQYDGLIVSGQNARANKDYEQAIVHFADALKMKPAETYPQEEIEALNKLIQERDEMLARQAEIDADRQKELDAQNQIEEAYQKVLTAGDNLLAENNYDAAIAKYEEALPIKKNNKEAQERITAANKAKIAYLEEEERKRLQALEDLKNAQKNYRDVIKTADMHFDKEDFDQAIEWYKRAVELKPDDSYPKDQLELATANWEQKQYELEQERQKQAERDAIKKQWMDLKLQAKEAVRNKDYQMAIGLYQKALALNEKDKEIPAEIIKIETLMAEEAARQLEQRKEDSARAVQESMLLAEREKMLAETKAKYDAFIQEADVAFELRAWDDAKDLYRKAENVRPEEEYPVTQINRIAELIAQEKAAKLADKIAQERLMEEEEAARKRQEIEAQRERASQLPDDNITEEQALAYFKALRESEEERRLNDFEDTKDEFEASKRKVGEDHNTLVDENVRQLNEVRTELVNYKETEAEIHNVHRIKSDQNSEEVKRALQEDKINHNQVIIQNESDLNSFKEFHDAETVVAEKSHDTYREELNAYQKELEARERALDIQADEIIDNNVKMLNKTRVHIDDKRLEAELYHDEVRDGHDKNVAKITLGDDDVRKMHNTIVNKNEIALTEQKAALIEQNEKRQDIHMQKQEANEDDKRMIEVSQEKATNNAESLHVNNREALETYKRDIQINKIDAEKIHSDIRINHETDKYQYDMKDKENNERINNTVETNARNIEYQRQDIGDKQSDVDNADAQRVQDAMQELEDWRNNNPQNSDEYRNLLAKQFGEGIHETTDQLKDDEGNTTQVIIRRIVVKGNKGDDYKKIIHKYGAVHYKNGRPISERTWMMETSRD